MVCSGGKFLSDFISQCKHCLVCHYFLAQQGKHKAERARMKVSESFQKMAHAQRQEAAQARKEEKRKAEKERLLNEEDPEKARKLEVGINFREQHFESLISLACLRWILFHRNVLTLFV